MKWFGRKAAGRDVARPVMGSPREGARLGEWPAAYAEQVREGYCLNPVAQRAVRLVAEAAAQAPVEASEPALAALVAERTGGQPLMETLAAQLLLHGNAFVQLLGDGAGGVAELFALRPERVTIETDANGWPVGYRYAVGSRVMRLPAEDAAGRPAVIHIRHFHPLDDHLGLGCLGAAMGAIAIHNAATRWNKGLLDNAARPSGALVYDPGDGSSLSAEQYARLKDEMALAYQGAGNAGRPMLLEGGLKWQAISMSPADMDFVGLKAAAAREIALAFGVPPMLMGLPGDNAYANYREANRALWRQAVVPLADNILGALAEGLRPWFADAVLRVAVDRVSVLGEERAAMWARIGSADFLSDEEKRRMLGVEA
ncbi:phage portal protein [Sphingomonas spermidinifaciens]|uniref:Phage portal protein n=1 Tax=Sphingomonas spermidinifaciens TaxID=1141889 RepID=A0A2A4B2J7_9SPHN|nr:phage portal protein [Sphingomonas spermidinifaciens]PCD01958.1 phage portal protein [Sphingomonas spermidinifaciens]